MISAGYYIVIAHETATVAMALDKETHVLKQVELAREGEVIVPMLGVQFWPESQPLPRGWVRIRLAPEIT